MQFRGIDLWPAGVVLLFEQLQTTAHIAKLENIRRTPGIRAAAPGNTTRIGSMRGAQADINVHRIGERIAKLRVLPYTHTGRAFGSDIRVPAIVVQHRHIYFAVPAQTNAARTCSVIGDQSPEFGTSPVYKKRVGIIDGKILVAHFEKTQ